MHNFKHLNSQKSCYQIDKGSQFFFDWVDSSLKEECKACIINEMDEIRGKIINITQIAKGDPYLPFSKSFLNALYQAAQCALKQGLEQESFQLFFTLSHLLPNSYDVFLGLGMAYQLLEKHQEAVEAYRRAEDIHPQLFQANLFSAESYVELRDAEKFKENIKKACELLPKEKPLFQQHAQYLIQKFNQNVGS